MMKGQNAPMFQAGIHLIQLVPARKDHRERLVRAAFGELLDLLLALCLCRDAELVSHRWIQKTPAKKMHWG